MLTKHVDDAAVRLASQFSLLQYPGNNQQPRLGSVSLLCWNDDVMLDTAIVRYDEADPVLEQIAPDHLLVLTLQNFNQFAFWTPLVIQTHDLNHDQIAVQQPPHLSWREVNPTAAGVGTNEAPAFCVR